MQKPHLSVILKWTEFVTAENKQWLVTINLVGQDYINNDKASNSVGMPQYPSPPDARTLGWSEIFLFNPVIFFSPVCDVRSN